MGGYSEEGSGLGICMRSFVYGWSLKTWPVRQVPLRKDDVEGRKGDTELISERHKHDGE